VGDRESKVWSRVGDTGAHLREGSFGENTGSSVSREYNTAREGKTQDKRYMMAD
jgi:hypothetical protein